MSLFQKILGSSRCRVEVRSLSCAMAEVRKRRKPVDVLVEVLNDQGISIPHKERGVIDSVALLSLAEESVGIVSEAGEKHISRVAKVADELGVEVFEVGAADAPAHPAPAPAPVPAPAPALHSMPRPDGVSGMVAAASGSNAVGVGVRGDADVHDLGVVVDLEAVGDTHAEVGRDRALARRAVGAVAREDDENAVRRA